MTTAQQLMTADDFEKKYTGSGPGKSELWFGEVRTTAPVGWEHQDEAGELIIWLRPFVKQHHLGTVGPELGCVLSADPPVVLAPDVAFVQSARKPSSDMRRRFFQGHPDLAIEVVSPDDTHTAVARKVATYLQFGTPRVWVVDPDLKTVAVHRESGDPHILHVGDALSSNDAGFTVDGFLLPLSELFPNED